MSKIKQQSTVAEKLKDHLSGNIDDQCAKGLKTYNKTLDECAYDDYDWNLMANQELVDSNQYLLMEIGKLNELLKAKDEEIARLQSFLSPPVGNGANTIIDGIPLSVLAERMKLLVEIENLRNQLKAVGLTDPKPEPEQSPKEALDSAVGEYNAVTERDEIIEDLQDEIEGLKKELESLKSEYWHWRSSANNAVSENKKLRDLLTHTWGED